MEGPIQTDQALSPRYKGVPRRYEDTKPVLTQVFTHSNILGIGQDIHLKWENKTEDEKQAAIKEAEDKVWQEATHAKNVALEKHHEQAQKDLEAKVAEMKIELEKALRNQTVKVESEMKLLALEQVKAEGERAAGVLKEMTEALIAEKDSERAEAVAAARKEEIERAATEAGRVAKETGVRAVEASELAKEEKSGALKDLFEKMEQEKYEAVLETQVEERRAAGIGLGRLQRTHTEEVNKLKGELRAADVRHNKALEQIEAERREKDDWIQKHDELKKSYQLFINETNGFKNGQADFLI